VRRGFREQEKKAVRKRCHLFCRKLSYLYTDSSQKWGAGGSTNTTITILGTGVCGFDEELNLGRIKLESEKYVLTNDTQTRKKITDTKETKRKRLTVA